MSNFIFTSDVPESESWLNGSSLPPDSDVCMPNSTKYSIITDVYQGIPETLTLNLICWICLLLLFAILRRTAWNYGRLALIRRSGIRWTRLFYRNNDQETLVVDNGNGDESLASIDSGCCSWLPAIFRISREEIKAKCGPDAVHYLSFQRHLITMTFIVTLISICIILPINFQGNLQPGVNSFGHTTLSNLDPSSKWLWVHACMGILFLPLSIIIMRRCTGRKPPAESVTASVMITNISKADRNVTTIKSYMATLFPNIEIKDVKLAYNINKLANLEEKRDLAAQARLYSDVYLRKTGVPLKVRPKLFGDKQDALEFYTLEEKKLTDEVIRCKAMALYEPLGIAFVTLPNYQAAQYVISHYRPSSYREWTLSHAPNPSDIFWENLSVAPSVWYFKVIIVNIFLFLVLFFLTTPAIIVNFISSLMRRNEDVNNFNAVVMEFLPTLLLWTMAALMPAIVSFSDKFLSHWTRSHQNYSIMTKTFSFLLLMTLILPSLGLTSAEAFVQWTLTHENNTFRWACVFLPDRGAFFVNYIITSAFIGTALEVIRFPELFLYVWYLLTSKSLAEKAYVQKAILYEFPFGVHYAWSLVVFSITMVYSLLCPLITPFGLVYTILKHLGDKHNLYFAYGPSDMSGVGGGKIHATAVRLVRISVLLVQISMAALAGLRGSMDARTMVLIMVALLTLITFFVLSPFPACSKPQPLQGDDVYGNPVYVAPVLAKSVQRPPSNSSFSTPDYGSSEITETSRRMATGTVNL